MTPDRTQPVAQPKYTPFNDINNATTAEDDEDPDSDFDDEPVARMNTVESLRKGIVKTDKNKVKEFTILLVGETGVGKTSVLSLIANVLRGHSPDQYEAFYDEKNENNESQKHSQTNTATVYEIKSTNGVTIRILDSPGLADTRGIQQDELHKKSIAEAIKDHITTVNAVLILANGTVPRLTVGTDYALSVLSAIFPRTLAGNIGLMFTNVSSPLSWNFSQDTIPPVLANANQFLLDNPVAMQKKYLQMKNNKKIPAETRRQLRRGVLDGEQKALDMLAAMFDWLDSLSPQPTKDILSLYEQSQEIEKRISNTLSQMRQATLKRADLQNHMNALREAEVDMNTYKEFQAIIKQRVRYQKSTQHHNTLCTVPDCYSNCHVGCGLDFTLSPAQLAGCIAMDNAGNTCILHGCGHPRDSHRHFNSLWDWKDDEQVTVDEDAKRKFEAAKTQKELKQVLVDEMQASVDRLTKGIDEQTAELGRLADEYAKLSLSGSFAGQVAKAVVLLEQNIESMRNSGVDQTIIKKVETSLKNMQDKLELLSQANERKKGKLGALKDRIKGFVGYS